LPSSSGIRGISFARRGNDCKSAACRYINSLHAGADTARAFDGVTAAFEAAILFHLLTHRISPKTIAGFFRRGDSFSAAPAR
jgi:hypothetical protein